MYYANLKELICNSSSTRKYFLSLPPETQVLLAEEGDYIQSAENLRLAASNLEKCCKAIMISERLFQNGMN